MDNFNAHVGAWIVSKVKFKESLIYNFRTKTYMTSKEAWSCCCEDFMPNKNGVEEEVIGDYVKDGNYLRRV